MMNGTRTIHSSKVVSIDKDRVIFESGWNHIDSCFLTEEQCRIHNNIPPKKYMDVKEALLKKLNSFIEKELTCGEKDK